MKKLFFIPTLALIILTALSESCTSSRIEQVDPVFATIPSEAICTNVEANGEVSLRVWGRGNTREDAISNAYTNALRDILFKGIYSGPGIADGKKLPPLVPEKSIERKNADFFENFFNDTNEYNLFISEKKGSEKSRKESHYKNNYNISIIVTINRNDLKRHLEAYGIL